MTRHRSAILVAAMLLSAVLAACGNDANDDASSNAAIDTTGITAAASTASAATTTVTASTDAPATTDASTTTSEAVRELNDKGILTEGRAYTAGTTALGAELTFTATPTARYSTNLPGFFGVANQASGDETLFYVTDLSTATVFTNPFEDYAAIGRDNTRLFAATEPIPGDYLEYFRALPGVTTGEIVDTTLLGQPARSMTFTIGSNEGGHPIPPGTDPLLLTFFAPSGITYTYLPGESGTLYTLDLAGKPLLAEVTNFDGAEEFAQYVKVSP